MTYRAPSFMTQNLLSAITDVTGTNIYNWSNTTSPSNAERRAWVDGRQGTVASIATTGTFGGIRFNLQSAPASGDYALVIPDGHGFDGNTLTIISDSTNSFASATNYGSVLVSGSGVIERSLPSATGQLEQWVLSRIDDSTNPGSYSLGGWWIGEKRTLSASAVAPDWGNAFQSTLKELDFPNGVATLELSPPRRTFTLRVRDIDPSGADYTTLSNVLQSRARPFWYWPPDDVDAGPYYVRLDEDGTRIQEFPAPTNGTRYDVEISMVEDRF